MLNKAFVTYFQHGAAVVQDKMYIYGGNHNGRYLNDIQVSKLSAQTHMDGLMLYRNNLSHFVFSLQLLLRYCIFCHYLLFTFFILGLLSFLLSMSISFFSISS
jgi:hypothetical protein